MEPSQVTVEREQAPASPLPWTYPCGEGHDEDDRKYIVDAEGMIVAPYGERDHHADPEYIVQSANMYPRLVEMLRKLEWVDDDWTKACPICGQGKPKHFPDCSLAALLKETE